MHPLLPYSQGAALLLHHDEKKLDKYVDVIGSGGEPD